MFYELKLCSRMQMSGQSFVSNKKWFSPSSKIHNFGINCELEQAREPNPSREKKEKKCLSLK
jgi:hypothetical protein